MDKTTIKVASKQIAYVNGVKKQILTLQSKEGNAWVHVGKFTAPASYSTSKALQYVIDQNNLYMYGFSAV